MTIHMIDIILLNHVDDKGDYSSVKIKQYTVTAAGDMKKNDFIVELLPNSLHCKLI